MPRGPRYVYDNAILHICSRGNNKMTIFHDDLDRKYFKMLLHRYKEKYPILLFNYCLMTNHLHLVIRILEKTHLAKFMQGLQLSYCNHYHRKYGYTGRFWQGRFISKAVENDSYNLVSRLYVEANPVLKGICKYPEAYNWSSYNHYALGTNDPLIDKNIDYIALNDNDIERQCHYRQLMTDYLKTKGTFPKIL